MKKIMIIACFALLYNTGYSQAYSPGDLTVTAGLGFGDYGYSGYRYSGYGRTGLGLGIVLNADYSIVYYMSAGLYGGTRFKNRTTAFGFGGRGSFHFYQMIDDLVDGDLMGDKIDVYASFYSGGEVYSARLVPGRFRIGGILGARYMFKENIGATIEFGGPMSIFMVGMSFKLLN